MYLEDESSTQSFGMRVAKLCEPPLIIYLSGELGAGKTTFARGFLRAFGYKGNVKSPTFSLVESYPFDNLVIYHFDLYRLKDPYELEFIGIRDVSAEQDAVCLIEWPNRGGDATPKADLVFCFEHSNDHRLLEIKSESTRGQLIIDKI